MEKHFTLTDNELEEQFRKLTLNPSWFSHEAHLRLAWIHLKRYGLDQAITNVCCQIKAFATFHGDADKYNTTVTVAAVNTVNHFMQRSEDLNFQELINKFPRLKTNFGDLIKPHFSIKYFHTP